MFLVSTSVCVCSYDMDGTQVAHATTYTHLPHILCICNGILPGFNVIKYSLVATDFDHKSWQMAGANPTYPFSKNM